MTVRGRIALCPVSPLGTIGRMADSKRVLFRWIFTQSDGKNWGMEGAAVGGAGKF